MSTPLKERTEPQPAPRKTWTIAIAAVAALVLAVAGGLALTGGNVDHDLYAEILGNAHDEL